jgi:hypothetical protein
MAMRSSLLFGMGIVLALASCATRQSPVEYGPPPALPRLTPPYEVEMAVTEADADRPSIHFRVWRPRHCGNDVCGRALAVGVQVAAQSASTTVQWGTTDANGQLAVQIDRAAWRGETPHVLVNGYDSGEAYPLRALQRVPPPLALGDGEPPPPSADEHGSVVDEKDADLLNEPIAPSMKDKPATGTLTKDAAIDEWVAESELPIRVGMTPRQATAACTARGGRAVSYGRSPRRRACDGVEFPIYDPADYANKPIAYFSVTWIQDRARVHTLRLVSATPGVTVRKSYRRMLMATAFASLLRPALKAFYGRPEELHGCIGWDFGARGQVTAFFSGDVVIIEFGQATIYAEARAEMRGRSEGSSSPPQ